MIRNIVWVFALSIPGVLIQACGQKKGTEQCNEVVLSVGEFQVTWSEFQNSLNTNSPSDEDTPIKILDHYISAGLLVEEAKRRGYEKDPKIIQALKVYGNQLAAEFAKKNRVKKYSRSGVTDFHETLIAKNHFVIDHVWVPNEQQSLQDEIKVMLENGTDVTNIFGNEKPDQLDSLGIRFYRKIPLESALLPAKVIDKLCSINKPREVVEVSSSSGSHLIRLVSLVKKPVVKLNKDNLLFNIQLANAVENGDNILDPYVVKRLIKSDNQLLSHVDLSIPPIVYQNGNPQEKIIARLAGREVTEEELLMLVGDLSPADQALFRNKSTRPKAIATMILLAIPDVAEDSVYRFLKLTRELLENENPDDTLSFLKHAIYSELKNISSYGKGLFTSEKAPHHSIVKLVETIKEEKPDKEYYPWLYPEEFSGYGRLELNYTAIEQIDFSVIDHPIGKNEVVAFCDNWKLTVGDLERILGGLTSGSRLEISKDNNLLKLIQYVAHDQANLPKDRLRINSRILKGLDIIGSSLDSVGYVVSEGAILGTLGETVLTVAEYRAIVPYVSRRIKIKLMSEEFRKEGFEAIIASKFWQNEITEAELMSDSLYIERYLKYQNSLLATAVYNEEIRVEPISYDDKRMNYLIRKAIRQINEERLNQFLTEASKKHEVYLNEKFLNKQSINISQSVFSQVIHNEPLIVNAKL